MRMGLGEREAVVDLWRPLDGVLRPSAGNHEYRLVKRRGQHNGSPSSVVGVGLVRNFPDSCKKRGWIGMKNAAAISMPKTLFYVP